jgi:hypothetical protein
MYFVGLEGQNYVLFDLLLGTVQGSILEPLVYAMFVSPMFDIEFLLSFADNIFVPKTNNYITELNDDMEKTLKSRTKWLNNAKRTCAFSLRKIFITFQSTSA